jgi:ABC-type multidrug transport system ATPase subunit
VLLSSHLLHEIEVVADDLIVIGQGPVVAANTTTDLLAGVGTRVVTRRPGTPSPSRRTRPASPTISSTRVLGLRWLVTVGPSAFRGEEDAEAVGRVARSAGVGLTELRAADGAGSKEEFLELIADTQRARPRSPVSPAHEEQSPEQSHHPRHKARHLTLRATAPASATGVLRRRRVGGLSLRLRPAIAEETLTGR